MTYSYKTKGTCSSKIDIEIADDGKTILNVKFTGGCNGNLKGLGAMVKGEKIEDVIKKLNGIKCGFKSTSCPDQLAKALQEIKKGD
ncbi:MAG: TIGR03905 family TSCPD domain-containing protein [Clostridiales bacterium]|nr:TIGR03905 family TSCPD domain-containing protein [Clostridiales bacterium]